MAKNNDIANILDTISSELGENKRAAKNARQEKRRAELVMQLAAGQKTRTKKDGKVVNRTFKAVDHLRMIDRLVNRLGGTYDDIPEEVAGRFDWKAVAASVEKFAKATGLNPAHLLGALGVGAKAKKVSGSSKAKKVA